MHIILLFTACIVACDDPPTLYAYDHFDSVELNHHFNVEGKRVLNQFLFFDWTPDQSRFQVQDYKLQRNSAQIPFRDYRSGFHHAYWYDGSYLRHMSTMTVIESWTQQDPEYIERSFLPAEKRPGLAQFPTPFLIR